MSSSKKDRRSKEQLNDDLMAEAAGVTDEIEEFVGNASPFELSTALAKTGISTCHRDGIDTILSQVVVTSKQKFSSFEFLIKVLLTGLKDRWKCEAQGKGIELDLEDIVFLLVAAKHFVIKWIYRQVQQPQQVQPSPKDNLRLIAPELCAQIENVAAARMKVPPNRATSLETNI